MHSIHTKHEIIQMPLPWCTSRVTRVTCACVCIRVRMDMPVVICLYMSSYLGNAAAQNNFERFTSKWPMTQLIKLSKNFRSQGIVVKAAAALIRNNPETPSSTVGTVALTVRAIHGCAKICLHKCPWVQETHTIMSGMNDELPACYFTDSCHDLHHAGFTLLDRQS